MSDFTRLKTEDICKVLSALNDLLAGFPERELAEGWRDAAWRLALANNPDAQEDWTFGD